MEQNYKFRGGVWIGFLGATWPFGILEVNQKDLVVSVESTDIVRKFSKNEMVTIKVVKVLPIIGYGVRITNETTHARAYFWYLSFKFTNLTNALKKLGWMK